MPNQHKEDWQVFSNFYDRWKSDKAYHPAALGCAPNISGMIDAALKILDDMHRSNVVNTIINECADVPLGGYGGDISARLRPHLLAHVGGTFINDLERELIKLLRSFPARDDDIAAIGSLRDLAKRLKTGAPKPPYYLPDFYNACADLIIFLRDVLAEIASLHNDHLI